MCHLLKVTEETLPCVKVMGCFYRQAGLWALPLDAFGGAKCRFELELPLRADRS